MIASLNGIVELVGPDHAVIDVNGVGYHVFASARTLGRMSKGERVKIAVETHVREDHIHLYGFGEAAERDWFRLLTTVQGVGAKTALAILSALRPEDLARAIVAADKTALSRADGVGGKLAARIAAELRDKVGALAMGSAGRGPGAAIGGKATGLESAVADAVSALANLGYAPSDAFGAVARAAEGLGKDSAVADLIRAGLAELSGARTKTAGERGR